VDWSNLTSFKEAIDTDYLPDILISEIWTVNQNPRIGQKVYSDGPKFPARILNSLGNPKTPLAKFKLSNFTLNDLLNLDPLRISMTPGMGIGTINKLIECLQWCKSELPQINTQIEKRDHTLNNSDTGTHEFQGIIAILNTFLNSLDEKQKFIVMRRLFTLEVNTLHEIAEELGISRERVRQIERGVIRKLQNPKFSHEKDVVRVISDITVRAKTWTTIDSLIETIKSDPDIKWWSETSERDFSEEALRSCIHLLPVLLPKKYSIETSELYRLDKKGNRIDPVKYLDEHIEKNSIVMQDFYNCLLEVGINNSSIEFLIKKLDLTKIGAYFVFKTANVLDQIESTLHIFGEPVRVEQILEELEINKNISSIKDRMAHDDRFIRVQRSLWGLREWPGYSEYSGIRSDIEATIKRNGNCYKYDELIIEFQNRFNANENSIKTYLTAPQYKIHEGMVYLIKPNQYPFIVGSPGDETLVHPTNKNIIGWKIEINKDVLRGSGAVMRTKFVPLLGLQPGHEITYKSDSGDLTLYWPASLPQPHRSSIRDIIARSNLEDSKEVFFIMDTKKRYFQISPTKPF
jgi:RNA polymerase sigma factor (sigma-70 family)